MIFVVIRKAVKLQKFIASCTRRNRTHSPLILKKLVREISKLIIPNSLLYIKLYTYKNIPSTYIHIPSTYTILLLIFLFPNGWLWFRRWISRASQFFTHIFFVRFVLVVDPRRTISTIVLQHFRQCLLFSLPHICVEVFLFIFFVVI